MAVVTQRVCDRSGKMMPSPTLRRVQFGTEFEVVRADRPAFDELAATGLHGGASFRALSEAPDLVVKCPWFPAVEVVYTDLCDEQRRIVGEILIRLAKLGRTANLHDARAVDGSPLGYGKGDDGGPQLPLGATGAVGSGPAPSSDATGAAAVQGEGALPPAVEPAVEPDPVQPEERPGAEDDGIIERDGGWWHPGKAPGTWSGPHPTRDRAARAYRTARL